MKKLILRSLALMFMVVASAGALMAQQPEQLGLDKDVRKGTLDNGMTYYIRHNETPKGQADFFIAQKVGSVLEEENQRGLAHFLEHMCFNGTTNFPGNLLRDWLESIGVKFGENLNAYTGFDETVYNISNVPVARKSVQDSCLLILHDWASEVTLDPVEIDKERGVIHEEWRRSHSGEMRQLEKLLPVMYPTTNYGTRLPIGIMEVVDNFPPQAIKDYYHKWYRPDNQAIIVVGDVDVDYIEGKIKEMFSHIKMPENAAPRNYSVEEETPGTIYALGSDKEIAKPEINMFFKSDALFVPREYRNTQMYYVVDYVGDMIAQMFNARMAELAANPEIQFGSAGVYNSGYFLNPWQGALTMAVEPKGKDILPAFQQAYRELLRAVRGGFTISEYERARTSYLAALDAQYQKRNFRQNGEFAKMYAANFTKNQPQPGIEWEKNFIEAIANQVDVNAINQALAQLVSDDNRVILALAPEAEGYSLPTEAQFNEIIAATDAENIEAHKDEMRTDPLIPEGKLRAPGKVVKTTHNKLWDATEYTLSNGVKVVVKPTDFEDNQIVFQAIAPNGGLASLDPKKVSPATTKMAEAALTKEGLYDYSDSDLRKYINGKMVSYSLGWSSTNRSLEGQTVVKDLPNLMELLYAYFTGFDVKEKDFEALRSVVISQLENQDANPQVIFARNYLKDFYKSPYMHAATKDEVQNVKRDDVNKFIRSMMANAADYTFYFVGDIKTDTFVPLMEKYLGALPGKASKNKAIKPAPAFEVRPGTQTSEHSTKMETPQVWTYIQVSGNVPYTAKNRAAAMVAGSVISNRLLNRVREELGATYSIGAQGYLSRTEKNNAHLVTAFPMKPEMKDQVLKEIRDMIFEAQHNIKPEDIKPHIEFQLKKHQEELKENSQWAASMVATSYNGVPVFLNTPETFSSLTADDVMNYLKTLLKQGNYRVSLLNPAEK